MTATKASTKTGKTVVALEEITVEPPLVDGARASISRHGIFSNVAAAMKAPSWIWEKKPSLGVRYFSIDEYKLNYSYGSDRSLILDGSTRKPRGLARWDFQPWDRLPRCTRLKPGQLVGFVSEERYRVGVVLALPLGPEDARRMRWLLGCQNVVLVGLLGARGNPRSLNHDIVPPALLFPVRHRVPPALRAALRVKFEKYRDERQTLERAPRAAKEQRQTRVTPKPHVDPRRLGRICRKHRIKRLSLFGSVVRDDFGPDSDVDILYVPEVGHRETLGSFTAASDAFADLFGRRVDFIERSLIENSKNPHRRQSILEDERVVYENGRASLAGVLA